MILNKTFDKTLAAWIDPKIRYIVNQGGSSSGKTYSSMQLLYLFCKKNNKPDLISVVSENLPHLKRGCIRDMQNIMMNEGVWRQKDYNKTEQILSIDKKQIEFFGADSPAKLHGGRRDYLYINEANNIGYEAYTQLAIRTRKKIIIDYNPSCEFWAHTDLIGRDDVAFIKTTYRDNINGGKYCLEQSVIDEIERRKYNSDGKTISDWYKVYGLGEIGSLEGAIYQDWQQCDTFPWNGNKLAGFIDFGYTNDPAACGVACVYNGQIYTHELFYNKGMTNKAIADEIKRQKMAGITFIADSAEPKSIAELRSQGISVLPAAKGKDSILNGIDLVKEYKINVTKDSLNAVKELRQYQWTKDKLKGGFINVPIDDWNHYLDGLRYWALIKLKKAGKAYTGRL